MTRRPHLLFVTGTRADFGLWLPVLRSAQDVGIDVRLLVMAMHLDPRFGHTVDEVRSTGIPIAAEIPCTALGDSRGEMAAALAEALIGAVPAVEHERPDWLLVLGDRGEQLGAALAALHLGVPVAHVHGGERTLGAVDDVVRDLLSRIASLHMVASEEARRRLISLGVDSGRIEVTGGPGLDAIAQRDTRGDKDVQRRYGVHEEPYLLVVQHPETMGDADPEAQMRATIDAVRTTAVAAVAVMPNADAGGRAMQAVLHEARDSLRGLFASIPREDFVALMAGAAAIVGNSSSALIEAPLLRLPAVNVGRRQEGRARGDNVVDVPADARAIALAIRTVIAPSFRAGLSGQSPYGDGHAAQRIVDRVLDETGVGT